MKYLIKYINLCDMHACMHNIYIEEHAFCAKTIV